MRVIGYRASEYKERLYVKLFTEEPVPADQGGGNEVVEHQCDASLAPKLKKFTYPCDVVITAQNFVKRRGMGGGQFTSMVIGDLEIDTDA